MGTLRRIRLWLRALFFKDRVEAELDDEIRFHLEKTMELNLRKGMTRSEARRRALIRFGGVDQVKEEVRDTRGSRPLEDLWSDLRFAGRSLKRRAGLTAVIVITLALGIGTNTAIFSILYGVLMRQLPYTEAERLIWVYDRYETWGPDGEAALSIPNFEDLRRGSQLFEDLAAFQVRSFNITGKDEPTRVRGAYVSAGFLSLFRTQPQIGRGFLPEEDAEGAPPVVILTDRAWRDRFGSDPDVMERAIIIDGIRHTVIGVVPPDFRFIGDPLILIPFALPQAQKFRGARNVRVVGRLNPEVAPEAGAAELASIFEGIRRDHPETNERWSVVTRPLKDWITGPSRAPLIILAGAVALVFLVACANVVTLLLARSETRRRELAVRAALGAGRLRLVRLFVTEILLLSVLGGFLAVLAAHSGLGALLAVFGSAIPRAEEVGINGVVLAFTFAISVMTGFAVGGLTGFRNIPRAPQEVLKEGGSVSPHGRKRLRQALVVGQVALALMLTTGSGLLLKSFWHLQKVDVGMRPDEVLQVQLSLPSAEYPHQEDVVEFYSSAIGALNRNPRVEQVGAVNRLGLTHGHWNLTTVMAWEDPEVQANQVEIRFVTTDYFSTMGIPLVRGRTFSPSDDRGSSEVVVISEELAQHLFADRDPVGARLNPRGPDRAVEVIGVVEDVREFGPRMWPRPTIYWHQAQTPNPDIRSSSLVIRASDDPMDLVPFVRQTVLDLDADLPVFGVASMGDLLDGTMGGQRFLMSLLGLFAGLAVALGAIGIYGLMSHSVAERTAEMGLRFALGQDSRQAVLMVVGKGAGLALLGIGIGILGAFSSLRVLSHMLFGVSPFDPVILAAGSAFLISVSLLACYLPARRAGSVDPLRALRRDA